MHLSLSLLCTGDAGLKVEIKDPEKKALEAEEKGRKQKRSTWTYREVWCCLCACLAPFTMGKVGGWECGREGGGGCGGGTRDTT